ncbi:MAG: chemotaxis protein MotB [Firmicutes bacterium]|nr:chemotaxis protein MotB [Bacillota bacterium]
MSRRKRKRTEENSSQGWLTTFSDLMTLLLTFFILLYSFSTLDAIKFKKVASALQSVLIGQGKVTIFENDTAPGDVPVDQPLPIPNDEDSNQEDITNFNKVRQMYNKVNDFIKEEGLDAEVKIRADKRGVIVDINERILFEPAEADLKYESKEILNTISRLIKQFPNEIVVEGHTDNTPIYSKRYPTNWELSVDRATSVVRYFAEEKSIDPTRLTAAGCSKYRPIAPNDSPENKSLNRRVNILIVIDHNGDVILDGREEEKE